PVGQPVVDEERRAVCGRDGVGARLHGSPSTTPGAPHRTVALSRAQRHTDTADAVCRSAALRWDAHRRAPPPHRVAPSSPLWTTGPLESVLAGVRSRSP